MRRSLAIRSLLVSAFIVAVFVVPLALLVRSSAEAQALTLGRSDARALTPILSLAGDPRVAGQIDAVARRALPRILTVVFPDGSVLGDGEVIDRDSLADAVALARARAPETFQTHRHGGIILYEPVLRSNGSLAVIRVLVPHGQLVNGVYRSWLLLGLLGVALVALAVVASDRIGRSVVRSVDRLADTARRLSRGDVRARVVPAGPREVKAVGVALNQLADRIDELLGTERAAIADLSHRLRTPVTALRAEVSTVADRSGLRRVELGIDELTKTIDQIIRDAAQPVRRGIGIVSDLAEIGRQRVAFWGVLAEDQHRRLTVDVAAETLLVAVVASELAATFDALIDNVFSHTPEGSGFTVTIRTTGEAVLLIVDDEGPGFVAGFDPVRGASGRGSTGLGLDIVRRIASEANGSLLMLTRADGGARVQVELPLVGP